MSSFRFGFLALVTLLFSSSAWSQSTGSLRGQVTDPSTAVIPGATVTVTGPVNKVKVASTNQHQWPGDGRLHGAGDGEGVSRSLKLRSRSAAEPRRLWMKP